MGTHSKKKHKKYKTEHYVKYNYDDTQTPSTSDVSDENAGYSKKKKTKKKKINKTVIKRSGSVAIMKERKKNKELKNLSRTGFKIKPNHRYRVDDGRIGICRFRGRTLFGKSSEDWVGIRVEFGDGVHNGTVKGKTYFRCAAGKGIMVRPQRIIEDLGLSDGTVLTKKMIKGSKQIRYLLEDIAYENEQLYQQKLSEKKRKKSKKQYNDDDDWRPPKFEDYEEDHSDAFKPRNYYSQTLFKNDSKPAKKLQMYEI